MSQAGTACAPAYQAVLFDLDGTLVDSAPSIAKALGSVLLTRGGPPIDVGQVRKWVCLGAETLVANGLAGFSSGPDADLEDFRRALTLVRPESRHVYPGVLAALKACHEAGLTMAVVTNKPFELSLALLKDLGMDLWFSVVVGGDTTAFAKPHPAPLRAALTTLRCHADDAIFIGDSVVDAEAADAAGVPFVLFEGGYGADSCPESLVSWRFGTFDLLEDWVRRGRVSGR